MTLRGRGSLWGLVLWSVEDSWTATVAWNWRSAFQLEENVNIVSSSLRLVLSAVS